MAQTKSLVDSTKDFVNKSFYTQVGTAAFVLALLGVGGYVGYNWNYSNRQQAAEYAFMDSFGSYRKAINMGFRKEAQEHKEELWDQVDMDFQNAYDQNKSSTLAPYFNLFRAQALIAKGNVKDGLALMKSAQKGVSSDIPFHYLYQTATALVELDQADMSAKGLKALTVLSENKKNPFADMAFYYLGEYALSQGDTAKAQQYWDSIIKNEPKSLPEYMPPSPWVGLAKSRKGIQ